jgi:hypothetical protein
MISGHTRIVAIAGSVLLLLFIVELVRRRRMKEEYSVLWVATAVAILVLAAWGGGLHALTHAIGAVSESSTLYFFGLLFVIFLLLHFSVRVSLLERRLTALVQEIALLNPQTRTPPRHAAELADGDGPPGQTQRPPAATGADDAIQT